jgi:hypothetical protein
LSTSLGQPTLLWPFSGCGMLGLLLLGAAACVVTWYKQPQERLRALGFLLFLGGMGTLAMVVGWGRAWQGYEYILSTHYVTMMSPTLCCLYFLGDFSRATIGRLTQFGLFALVALLFWSNVQTGQFVIEFGYNELARIKRDVRAGKPPFIIAERHAGNAAIQSEEDRLLTWMRMLHRAGVGPFRALQDGREFRAIPFTDPPTAVEGLELKDGIARRSDGDSSLLFSLKEPRFVSAIRVKCEHLDSSNKREYFTIDWGRGAESNSNSPGRNERVQLDYSPADKVPRSRTLTFWVNDTIDRFRVKLESDRSALRLGEITLLVSDREGPGPK